MSLVAIAATACVADGRLAVPLPEPALLAKQARPSCDQPMPVRSARAEAEAPQSVAGRGEQTAQPDWERNLVYVKNLEREVACYRRAERRARERLEKLQASVADTARALGPRHGAAVR